MAGEEPDPRAAQTPGKGRMMPVVVVALLMGVEGVGVFFLVKAISPDPVPALAAGTESDEHKPGSGDQDQFAEIELAECRPSNTMTGRFITFHVRVSALVSSADLERAERLVRAKRARLEDGVNTVIRSADPKHLNEPSLETIKRRLKHEFNGIFGDEQLIKRVLIPQLLQSRAGV